MERTFRATTIATLALVAAAVSFASALARAVAIDSDAAVEDAKQPAPGRPIEDAPPEQQLPARPLPMDALRLAADVDPFMPDRERGERYVLPGERIEAPRIEPPPPPPPLRLIGTAVVADGGIAIVQLEDDSHRLLEIGDLVEGYRLATVHPFSATLQGEGRSVDLHVQPPSPNPAADQRRSARGARGNARGRQNAEQNQVREQLLRAYETLRTRGAPPEVLEQLMERMRDAGIEEIRTENGRVIIRGGRGIEREVPLPFFNFNSRVNRDTLDGPNSPAPSDR